MEDIKEYLIPWIGTNSIAILFISAAILKPKVARFLFVILFAWASWINYTIANTNPTDYLNYAALTPSQIYENFINGWFKENITPMVTIISVGQGLIALGMLLNKHFVRIACIGAILFFIAISPLGIGSGFPAPILGIVAIYFILKKDKLNYLWNFRK